MQTSTQKTTPWTNPEEPCPLLCPQQVACCWPAKRPWWKKLEDVDAKKGQSAKTAAARAGCGVFCGCLGAQRLVAVGNNRPSSPAAAIAWGINGSVTCRRGSAAFYDCRRVLLGNLGIPGKWGHRRLQNPHFRVKHSTLMVEMGTWSEPAQIQLVLI